MANGRAEQYANGRYQGAERCAGSFSAVTGAVVNPNEGCPDLLTGMLTYLYGNGKMKAEETKSEKECQPSPHCWGALGCHLLGAT